MLYGVSRVWLPHKLQALPTQQFARVINRVLRGEEAIIKLASAAPQQQQPEGVADQEGKQRPEHDED
jgi:hypothetical protein